MGTILAIDPGNATGLAYIGERGMLDACAVLGSGDVVYWIGGRNGGTCVIEIPQVYRGDLQKGDPNDLIDLAVMAGRYAREAERHGSVIRLVRPREWKGQLPKDVCWRRVKETLTPDELATVKNSGAPSSLAHNMHDAIGLATWLQGRWK